MFKIKSNILHFFKKEKLFTAEELRPLLKKTEPRINLQVNIYLQRGSDYSDDLNQKLIESQIENSLFKSHCSKLGISLDIFVKIRVFLFCRKFWFFLNLEHT